MRLTRFLWLLTAALCLLAVAAVPCRAGAYVVKQASTQRPLLFLMVQSADHQTPATGLTPTVLISKNGAAFGSPSGTVTETGQGWYALAANATDNNTLGVLLLHATAAGADPVDVVYDVVAYDPQAGTNLGLSNLDATVSSRSTYAGADTAGTTTLLTRIPGTVQPQTGDSYARLGAPVGASIAADIQTRSTYAGTDTAGTTALLTRVPGVVQAQTGDAYARLGAPAGASVSADIAAVPAAVHNYTSLSAATNTGTSTPALTELQKDALLLSVNLGNYDADPPVANGTGLVRYYLVGRPHTSAYLVETATVTYNGNKVPIKRDVVVSNPFPTLP